MKKLLVMAFFGLMCMGSYAQKETYCEVVVRPTFSFKGKVKINVDFGQANKVFEGANADVIKDPATGKTRKFNSRIDALNFMASKGWLFVNAYATSSSTSDGKTSSTYHYIMRKVAE